MSLPNQPTSSILLKRSGIAGSVPTTSSLQVGEIALNTYDGKAFLHKSGSTDEVVEIVVAGANVTGSISLTGAVTASAFIGSGAGLTDIPFSALSQELFRIASGSVTASALPDFGFKVESVASGSQFTGSVAITGSILLSGSKLYDLDNPRDLIFPFISANNYYFYDTADGGSPLEGDTESRNIWNGGTGTTPTTLIQNTGSSFTMPSSSGFLRNGYTFLGWSTSSTATTATYTAGNSYVFNVSRTSMSTSSRSSGSSTWYALFKKTTKFGTPTCFANRMCSRVCGIGPSVAATTIIAPSI